MRGKFIISFFVLLLSGLSLAAQTDSLRVVVDTTSVADTVLSTEDVMKLLASPQQDTVKKVVDRGFDVSRMVNSRRQRSVDVSKFVSESFFSNTFASARATFTKIVTEDYGYGLGGGVSFGKWLHEDHAVRLAASVSEWQENYKGSRVQSMSVDASYLFNLSSYVGGYRTNRFCEVSVVAGLGYSNSYSNDKLSHAMNGHVGANINMRLFKNVDFFIEPLAVIYTNGMAVSYVGNWRSWLSGLTATCGLTWNIKRSSSDRSAALYAPEDGWYVYLLSGPQAQNSRLVNEVIGLENALGIHVGLGIGKYYTDWFSIRYGAAYSRNTWNEYDGTMFPCNYFSARAEAVADLVGLINLAAGKKEGKPRFSASVLFGPEAGYMYKVDHPNGQLPVVSSAYLGLTGGIQAKARIGKRLALFLEPRFSIVPFDTLEDDYIHMNNEHRNYYDTIYNVNFGIEYLL